MINIILLDFALRPSKIDGDNRGIRNKARRNAKNQKLEDAVRDEGRLMASNANAIYNF